MGTEFHVPKTSPTRAEAEKGLLRERVLAHLKEMTASERTAGGARARARLERQPVWKRARVVLLYAPVAWELDVWPLLPRALSGGKIVALPRFSVETGEYVPCQVNNLNKDIAVGRFGIREPVKRCAHIPLKRLDFVLVPGVGFSVDGGRLGRGQGYYDRLLRTIRGTTCGVGFDEQIVAKLPVEPHDLRVNCILTPALWLVV